MYMGECSWESLFALAIPGCETCLSIHPNRSCVAGQAFAPATFLVGVWMGWKLLGGGLWVFFFMEWEQ